MPLSPTTLRGNFVQLEPLDGSHRDALVAAAEDGELFRLKVTVVPSASSIDRYLAEAKSAADAGREFPFVVRERASARVVGTTRYRNIQREHRRIEIGSTWLAASAQRTAINTEAKLLLLTHAFEVLGCQRVEFLTDALNTRSRAAIVRLGAVQEGVLRSHMVMPDGRVRDSAIFSILATEWAAAKAALQAKLNSRG